MKGGDAGLDEERGKIGGEQERKEERKDRHIRGRDGGRKREREREGGKNKGIWDRRLKAVKASLKEGERRVDLKGREGLKERRKKGRREKRVAAPHRTRRYQHKHIWK